MLKQKDRVGRKKDVLEPTADGQLVEHDLSIWDRHAAIQQLSIEKGQKRGLAIRWGWSKR